MKKLKKVLLLGLTFAMSATLFAACGGKGGDGGNGGVPGEDVKGEAAATQEDWNAAWEATLLATNFTMDFVKTYSEVGEGSHDWCEVEEEGFIKIADGKQWSKYDYSEVWDYSAYEPDDQGEETGVWEEYYGTIDGVSYKWYYEENQWHQSSAWNDNFATGAGVIEEMFEEFDYEWLYGVATYDSSKGAYTYSWEETKYDEVFNNTIEIKIKDGKIVAGKKIMHCDDQGEGYEIDEVVVCSITYGNTEIGKLPGEEGFGEEEEDGNSSELGGSSEGGEIGGADSEIKIEYDFDKTYGNDIVGEQVSADEMTAAINKTLAATNFTTKGHSYVNGGASLIITNVANGKSYNATRATYLADGEMETTTMHMILGEVDGVDYAWMSFDGETWECELADEVVMGNGGATGQEVFGSYLSLFSMGESTFNATTGAYTVAMEGMSVSIKIVDDEVKVITYVGEMEGESMYVTSVIEYGNAIDITLPDLNAGGSDIEEVVLPKGEQVNAESWSAAIAATMAADNFFAEVGMDGLDETGENLLTRGIGLISIANNKGYVEMMQEVPGFGTFRMYSYCGNVGDKNYVWESYDGESWSVEDSGAAITIDGAWMVEELLPEDLAFESWTYDETTGGYRYVWTETLTVTVGIIDGKIGFLLAVSTDAEDQSAPVMIEKYLFTYGNATIGELPPIENAGE